MRDPINDLAAEPLEEKRPIFEVQALMTHQAWVAGDKMGESRLNPLKVQ